MTDFKKQGRRNRQKGHDTERWVARELREMGYEDAKRDLEYQFGKGYDVHGGPFLVQCKRGKKYANPNKIEEVPQTKDKIPLLLAWCDRRDPIVCLYWRDFRALMEKTETSI